MERAWPKEEFAERPGRAVLGAVDENAAGSVPDDGVDFGRMTKISALQFAPSRHGVLTRCRQWTAHVHKEQA